MRERLQAKTAERDALQDDLRERERGLEAARMRVLRLLGEASTLRNQLVQIDEYLAAIERDSARARKEEEIGVGRSGAPGPGEERSCRRSCRRGSWSSNRWPTAGSASKKN